MLRLAEWAIARPLRTLTVFIFLILIAAPGFLRLELRTDGKALVPKKDPVIQLDTEARAHFGLRDPVIVFIATDHDDGIFNLNTLARIRDLSAELASLPCIGEEHVISLATERSDRFITGTPELRWLIDPLPATAEDMAELRSAIAANQLLDGTLVSLDRKGAAILVGIPNEDAASRQPCADRVALYKEIRSTVEPFANSADEILVVGAPVAESLLGLHILEDLTVLVPLAMTLIAIILWLGCRRLWGVLLGLGEVGAALIWTFGVMGWMGFPVYLTTAVLPVILTAIGLADEIHIFWRFQKVLDEEPGAEPALQRTMREMTRPIMFTSLTSTIGFLSFLASPIEPIRSFGLFAAIGILFCMAWSLTVVPAALSLLPSSALRRPRSSKAVPNGMSRRLALAQIVKPFLEHRGLTLAVLILLTLGLGAGAARLFVQDSWLDGFSSGSPFRQASDRVNRALFGTHVLLAHLTFELPEGMPVPTSKPYSGPLLGPDAMTAVGAFEEFLRAQPGVGGVLGTHSQYINARYLQSGRYEPMRSVPAHPADVLIVLRHLEEVRGKKRLSELIDDDFRRTIVTIFLKDANYRQTAALMDSIRAYEKEHLVKHYGRVDFAGDVAVSQAMIPAIVRSQITSLLLALGGAFLALCLLYRSLRRGLLAVLPACLAVFWVFGAMGWLAIPLGVATSMFCAITLGIGVDHSIHFLERFDRARAAGRDRPSLVAVSEAGPAIVADTLAVALGFGLLGISQIPANVRLGLLVALALVASCILTLLGLGAWLANTKRSRAAEVQQDS